MGAQLNIKDVRAVQLARKLADQTGQSVTAAVREALEREVKRVSLSIATSEDGIREREAHFYHLIRGSRGRWKGAMLSIDHGDLLYDEDGLPR